MRLVIVDLNRFTLPLEASVRLKVVFVAAVKTFIEADIENILVSKVRTLRRARDILFEVRVYHYSN